MQRVKVKHENIKTYVLHGPGLPQIMITTKTAVSRLHYSSKCKLCHADLIKTDVHSSVSPLSKSLNKKFLHLFLNTCNFC